MVDARSGLKFIAVVIVIGVVLSNTVIIPYQNGVMIYDPFSSVYRYVTFGNGISWISYNTTGSTFTPPSDVSTQNPNAINVIVDNFVVTSYAGQFNFTIQQNYYLTSSNSSVYWIQTVAFFPSSNQISLENNIWRITSMAQNRVSGYLLDARQVYPPFKILNSSFNITLISYVSSSGYIVHQLNYFKVIAAKFTGSVNLGAASQFVAVDPISRRASGTVFAGPGNSQSVAFTQGFAGYVTPAIYRGQQLGSVSVALMLTSESSSAEKQQGLDFSVSSSGVSWKYVFAANTYAGYKVTSFG